MMRTVLVYGDSNTHGTPPMKGFGDTGRHARADRWTTHMAAALPDWEVVVEGQPGRTTVHDDPIEGPHRNGLTVLPAMLESHGPVDLVVIKLGTNDLKARFALTPTDIALGVERLLTCLRQSTRGPGQKAPAAMVICPPPIIEAGDLGLIFAGGATKSQALWPAFQAMAARAGVPLVNAADQLAVSPIDGIHYDVAPLAPFGLAVAAAIRHHFG
jgi:lysophospholipase L1-like esterase